MYFVYVLRNKLVDKIYIGQTIDLSRRLDLHNNHQFKNSFTARCPGKWELVYKEKMLTRSEALRREKQLKSYQGRLFLKQHILCTTSSSAK